MVVLLFYYKRLKLIHISLHSKVLAPYNLFSGVNVVEIHEWIKFISVVGKWKSSKSI